MHYATHTQIVMSNSKKEYRKWTAACKKVSVAPDKWARPPNYTDNIREVKCKECLENSGLELLDLVP